MTSLWVRSIQLLISCNRLNMNKPISGCLLNPMACNSFLMTSLLQVVNRLVASWLWKLVILRLAASCFNKFVQLNVENNGNDKLQPVWCQQTCCNLMKLASLLKPGSHMLPMVGDLLSVIIQGKNSQRIPLMSNYWQWTSPTSATYENQA